MIFRAKGLSSPISSSNERHSNNGINGQYSSNQHGHEEGIQISNQEAVSGTEPLSNAQDSNPNQNQNQNQDENQKQDENQNQNSDGTSNQQKKEQGTGSKPMKISAQHSHDQLTQEKLHEKSQEKPDDPHRTTSDQKLLYSLYGYVELLFITLGMNLKTVRYSNKSAQDSNPSNQEVVDSISRIISDVVSSGIHSPVSKYPLEEGIMEDWRKTYVNIDDSKVGAGKKYSNILRVVITYIANDTIQHIPNHLLYPEKSENYQELFDSDVNISSNNQYDQCRNVPRSDLQKQVKQEEEWDPK